MVSKCKDTEFSGKLKKNKNIIFLIILSHLSPHIATLHALPPPRAPHTLLPHAPPQLGGDVSRVTIAPKGDSVPPNGVIPYLEQQKPQITNLFSPLGL
jgi:hypothetical protein